MLIRKFQLDQFKPCGDSRLQELFPWEDVIDTPFGAGWMYLEPGQASHRHQHHELETFIVVAGKGEMRVDEEGVEVGPGDVVYMPPFHKHVLHNTSESEDLLFFWLYWEDMSALARPRAGGERKSALEAEPPGEVSSSEVAGTAADLEGRSGQWLQELAASLQKEFDGVVPATGLWTDEQRRFYEELVDWLAEANAAQGTDAPSRATTSRLLGELVDRARHFARRERRSIGVPERRDERRTAVALELTAAKVLAALSASVAPELSSRLWSALGYQEPPPSREPVPTWVPAGRRLGDLAAAVVPGPGTAPATKRKTLICTCPPTSNGELHLGHLAGPILSADILARGLRMLGEEAYYILGTDDNQSWIAAKARQMGKSPHETADHFAGKIARIVEVAQLNVEAFFRPGDAPGYTELIREVVEKLYGDGHLVARDRPALFCDGCGQFLFEPYVSGSCPHCGQPCAGNACEDCGRPVNSEELVDPVCRACSKPAERRSLRRLYFPLEPHRQKLEEYCGTVAMSTQHRALLRCLLDGELPEIVATHPGTWGIPVPVAGFEGQTISAWIEMGPGYVAGSRLLSEKLGWSEGWRAFWTSDETRVIQTFGFDNCWNHGLLYPALLMAWDPDLRPPEAFLSNYFYLLDHQKFSTTRNHAVWGLDFIERNSADTVRFYLAWTCPEAERTNFSFEEFRDFVEEELRGRWQVWLRDLAARVEEACQGQVPRRAAALTANQQVFQENVQSLMTEAEGSYGAAAFSPQRITRIACELVRLARDFGKAESSWAGVASAREQHRTGIALELAAARSLALLTAPVMPGFAAGLWRAVGCDGEVEQQRWEARPRLPTAARTVRGLGVTWFPPPRGGGDV